MDIDLSEKICRDSLELPFYDCDYKKRIKISTLLKITAQIAGKDYTDRGLGHDFLWENHYVFLISRVSIHIEKYATEPEILDISTWECGKRGAMFMRGYRVENNGEIYADGESGWVVVNPETRKMLRPSSFPWQMPQIENMPVKAKPTDKIACENPKWAGEHLVKISDLDANGHVYNANYADIALNVLSPEEFERDILNFRINFVNEAILGDRVELFRMDRENITVIVGKIGDKICFETETIFR